MSALSQALQKHYAREGNRLVFKNKMSLNQLALVMWEQLGFRQIDASVLSRVLKGDRSFTSEQLKVFCSVLDLSTDEEAYLTACLHQDRSTRLGAYGGAQLSPTLAAEVMEVLTNNAFEMFYTCDYDAIDRQYELVSQLAEVNAGDHSSRVNELVGLNMYLKGRVIANGELPSRVVSRVTPIVNQLLSMSRINESARLYGYAHVLLSTAYYSAGGYSNQSSKHKFYKASMEAARRAVSSLPDDDHEALFALRSFAASASYIHDQSAVRFALHRAKEILPKQPRRNYINALHLSITLTKSVAASNISDPFSIREYAANHFQKDLTDTGVYEISAIKEEIDTLRILKTQDTGYIQQKLKEGLTLAVEYNFLRQKKYFDKLLATV